MQEPEYCTLPRRATSTSFGAEKGNQPGSKNGSPGAVYHKRMKWLAELAAKSKRMEQVLKDPDAPLDDFLKVFDRVSDRSYGKPVQPQSHDGNVALNVVVRHENPRQTSD